MTIILWVLSDEKNSDEFKQPYMSRCIERVMFEHKVSPHIHLVLKDKVIGGLSY